jgi:predicted aspartyl protease
VLAQNADKYNNEANVKEIIGSTDGFALEDEYNNEKKENQPTYIRVLYEMKLGMLFNQGEKALNLIDTLITKYHTQLGSFSTADLIADKVKILETDGQYVLAANYIRNNLHLVNNRNDSSFLIKREDHYNEMRDVSAPEISRPHKDCKIAYSLKTNPRGSHYIIQAVIKGKTYSFIYDTCGGYTTVTEEMAKDMGLQLINNDFSYGGSGGTTCKNATTDSIVIGDIVYRHPLIHIDPVQDSRYAYIGVLGNDFMNRIGSFTIYTAKHEIVFPYKTKPSHKQHNMMYGRGLYFLQAHTGKERILFSLDSGAYISGVLAPYYQRHKEWFDQNGIKDTLSIREIGKKHLQDFMTLKSMPFSIGKTKVTIKNVLVFPKMHFDAFGDQQGIFGTSFFECFRKVTVNFRDMYVEVKK